MKKVKKERSSRAGNTEKLCAAPAAKHCCRIQIMSRLRNGGYQNALKHSCQMLLKQPSTRHLEYFRTDLMWMFLGDHLMRTCFRDYTVRRMSEYDGVNRLFHFTPTESVDSIRSTGLKPSDRFVYLTDAPDKYKHAFSQWKDEQIGKLSAYTLLEIDTQSLMHEQTIFCTNMEHEFVTGKIDAKYISVVSDSSSKRDLAR